MIKTIAAERQAIISAKSPHLNVKKIQDLIKIKSIGLGIATVLVGVAGSSGAMLGWRRAISRAVP